jgi:hypothetical protein
LLPVDCRYDRKQDLQIMSHRNFSGLAAFVEKVQTVLVAGVVQDL